MDNLAFYHISTTIPEFKTAYSGSVVLDSNNEFYLGLADRWLRLLDERDLVTTEIETATSTSTALATAYQIKQYVESKMLSTDAYKLAISDSGAVSCVKNGTDEGFQINENGVVSLA